MCCCAPHVPQNWEKLHPWLILTSAFHKRCRLLHHWDDVQTWEVAELLPESILEVYLVQTYTLGGRGRGGDGVGIVGLEGPCMDYAVSAMCSGEREKGGWKKGRNTTSSGDDLAKHSYIFLFCNFLLYLQHSPVVSGFINLLLLFVWFTGETFVNSFIFSWGTAFLAQLIFGSKTSGFNLRGLYY